MKIEINLELSRAQKHVLRWGLVIGATVGALGLGVAFAAPIDTGWIDTDQPISASKLKGNFTEVETRLALLETQLLAANGEIAALKSPDHVCPAGYTRDASDTAHTVCKKGVDEVVKVSTGPAAFWVDRYEASVWSKSDGTGTQFGATADDYLGTFPKNGQVTSTTNLLYAASKAGVPPSISMTWFQAAAACRASGKRLPTGEEWLAAAMGTTDPAASPGTGGACLTSAGGKRNTGVGAGGCMSTWGAQDMIGNVWEWTNEWYAGLTGDGAAQPWPETTGGEYKGDNAWNIAGKVVASGSFTSGLPAAGMRGGAWSNGTRAGVFALFLDYAPSEWASDFGFRCILPSS